MSLPFFMLPHTSILRLQSLFSSAALMVSAFYAALVIAEWQGPYGLVPLTLIWLVGLAFYPVTLFLWSFFELHYLLREIKLRQIKAINAEVVAALNKVLREHKNEDADYLDKAMGIQGRIRDMHEWPIEGEVIAAFLLTLVPAVTQIIISVF